MVHLERCHAGICAVNLRDNETEREQRREAPAELSYERPFCGCTREIRRHLNAVLFGQDHITIRRQYETAASRPLSSVDEIMLVKTAKNAYVVGATAFRQKRNC
jgi:hypothetical protein